MHWIKHNILTPKPRVDRLYSTVL